MIQFVSNQISIHVLKLKKNQLSKTFVLFGLLHLINLNLIVVRWRYDNIL